MFGVVTPTKILTIIFTAYKKSKYVKYYKKNNNNNKPLLVTLEMQI